MTSVSWWPLSELTYHNVFRLIVDMTSANWWPLSELMYPIVFRLIVNMTSTNWWPLSELMYNIVFRLIVDMTSANCSHQVQQELSSTFARLCHLVIISRTKLFVRPKIVFCCLGWLHFHSLEKPGNDKKLPYLLFIGSASHIVSLCWLCSIKIRSDSNDE